MKMTKKFIPTFFSKPKLLFIFLVSMASLFSVTILSLFLLLSFSSAARHQHRHFFPPFFDSSSASPSIAKACKSTRYPAVCESSLSQFPKLPAQPTPLDLLLSLISVSTDGLKTAQSMVQGIFAGSSGNLNRSNAAKSCIEVLTNSQRRIASSVDALPRGNTKDARAWMSAALAYQYDCWSGLKYVNDTQKVNSTMSFLNSLIGLSSNALSMMMSYDLFGNEIDSWAPPKTERDGFWEGSGAGSGAEMGFKGGVPSGLKADVTVCGGGCDYKAVQDAVDAAPSNLQGNKRFVIYIKEGVYEETVRVPFEKTNVVFWGDGMGKTIITGSLYSGMPGITTYTCATVGVMGDGFMASGLTIQNTAGPNVHQAVAFRSDSDLSVLENVEFLGNQDTLYAHSLRQFYKSCFIQGNVDFIFGNSAGYFQDCTILVRPRQLKPEKGENNAVTAHGRIDPAQSTGFVFQNCIINGTEEYMRLYNSKPKGHKNFLGRPWKEYSRTVFLNSNLEALITPQGWMPWSGNFALSTLFYGEAGNSGPGSDVSQRVNWSSKIPQEHLSAYSVQSFIQGNEWIPTSS